MEYDYTAVASTKYAEGSNYYQVLEEGGVDQEGVALDLSPHVSLKCKDGHTCSDECPLIFAYYQVVSDALRKSKVGEFNSNLAEYRKSVALPPFAKTYVTADNKMMKRNLAINGIDKHLVFIIRLQISYI